jgi:MoxR-like ATPase
VQAQDILDCQAAVREVHVDPKITKYVLDIVHASREHDDVGLGGSPRASIALFRCGQALAAIGGRDFVTPDDIKRMAYPVLGHRMILKPESRLRKKTPALVVKELVDDARVPVLDRQIAEA